MLRKCSLLFGQLVFVILSAACALTLVEPLPPVDADLLYQTSTLEALNLGTFDGEMTVAALAAHGDFGLGTFNALDGEMIVLDGAIYQARDDGLVQLADGQTQTPFAAVTHFQADQSVPAGENSSCGGLQSQIDEQLPTLNIPYAIKVSGEFAFVQVRAPRRQRAPYPTLTGALVDQAIFESQNISGTLVGFRLPEYLAGANVAGYHFHFISDDKQRGGHVLDCQVNAVTVEIDTTDRIYIDISQD